ncbi:MAG: hypothetical protein DPW16_15835 [Chloroflexi bacterium]|nr:hypothetical protein [Chloroflexota bacterium]
MPITNRLLERPLNRIAAIPGWATLNDWFELLTCDPRATPLVDFGREAPLMRVGVTALNWFLMDMLGLRAQWYDGGWERREEVWLLINPLRYRILGHQPRRPYALDVRDYLRKIAPHVLNESLSEHAYFACAPTIFRDEVDDGQAEILAGRAPWGRIAVLDKTDAVVGMVCGIGPTTMSLPPILKPTCSCGGVTYST